MTFYYQLHKGYKLNFLFITFFPIHTLLSVRILNRNPFTGIWWPMTNLFMGTAVTTCTQMHLLRSS